MADTNFQYKQTTIQSAWLQDVNNVVYRVLGNPTTVAQAITNLGVAKQTDLNTTNGNVSSNTTNITSLQNTYVNKNNNLSDLASASTARTNLGLGTASTLNTGTSANNAVQLDSLARLPAVDGSQLTNLVTPGKNRIINGNFVINQRGYVSGTALAAGAYAHDRWKAGSSGCTYTFTQAKSDTQITITAGSLQQIIEDVTIEGGTFTLSWSGTAQGRVNGATYAGSPVTVTGLVAGTAVTVEFNTGTIGIVQFEANPKPTPFERRHYQQELVLCQRYFWVLNSGINIQGYSGSVGANCYQTVIFPVTMRAAPTATANWSSGTRNGSQSVTQITTSGCQVMVTSNATGDYAIYYNAGNSFTAEL